MEQGKEGPENTLNLVKNVAIVMYMPEITCQRVKKIGSNKFF